MFIYKRITIVTTYYVAFDRMPLRGGVRAWQIQIVLLLQGRFPADPHVAKVAPRDDT